MKSSHRRPFRPSVDQAVMEALVWFSKGHAACNPSLYEISKLTGFSRRAVCRAIQDLKNRRVLMLSHRFASDGRQLSNEYRMTVEGKTRPARGGAVCHVT